MTRLIIHIGPHKTGTTYIQEALHSLRGALLDRGIFVPSIWNAAPGLPSHMQLAWAIRNQDLALVQAQASEILNLGYSKVVISCEALSRLNLEQVIQLRQLLGSVPAQVIYHVRRWPERLPSLWQESIKFGHTATFPEFLLREITSFEESELRDVFMIDRYATVFGASQIKLVSYSHLVDQDVDIAGHFLAAFLGITDIAPPALGRPNQSLPLLDTELIRALNAIHDRQGGERSTAPRDWYLAHREGLVPGSCLEAMRQSVDTVHLDEAAAPFNFISRDLLHRYASSVVSPRHTSGLHELQSIDVPYVRQDYLLDPDVRDFLLKIHAMYSGGV